MKFTSILALGSSLSLTLSASIHAPAPAITQRQTKHLRPEIVKRQDPGEPIVGTKGGQFLEAENDPIALQNPNALRPPPTDGGSVVNLKWNLALSNMLLFPGGFVREQLVTDLPPSVDFAAAQSHLNKGAIRQLHWHDINEWGYVTNGSVLVSAVDSQGKNQVFIAKAGDIWYFPKGQGHALQGIEESGNEFLLVFDNGNFDTKGRTFNIDDWINHTPPEVLAQNFGVSNDTFKNTANPYGSIANGKPTNGTLPISPFGELTGNSSYHFPSSTVPWTKAPGGGGSYLTVDTSNFPVAKNLASRLVEILPGGLREMHWHPNGAEWLYFQSGSARATVWLGGNNARTFDFTAGDTAVFPDNSGHYIENLSKTESVFLIEIYKADSVQDISLQQWLALTPKDLVAQILNVSSEVVDKFKLEKQVLIKA